MSSGKNLRIALVQMQVGSDKKVNLKHAEDLIRATVAKNKPDLVCLPEFFNAPYETHLFATYAETIPDGETCKFLSTLAKELKVQLVGGSIPEKDGKNLYNTCTFWSAKGELLSKHRKVHLFDVDIPNIVTYKESAALSYGKHLSYADVTSGVKAGFGICFDIQFPEMWIKYREIGCNLMIIPSAFPLKYGDLWWELYLRARAVDTQSFVTMISPARDVNGNYVAHGYTMMIDPFGKVIASAKEGEEVVVIDLDFSLVEKARKEVKLFEMRRPDLFELTVKSGQTF
ncbi:omega-amidase NIT2-like [Sergentomyia squamirostris]